MKVVSKLSRTPAAAAILALTLPLGAATTALLRLTSKTSGGLHVERSQGRTNAPFLRPKFTLRFRSTLAATCTFTSTAGWSTDYA